MSMSDSEVVINVKGPSELKLQLTINIDKTVANLKQAIAEKSDVEADRQRLIYSGRVLKDDDKLSVYKIQSNHTIHMVKGAARSTNASSSAQSSAPQPLPNMHTGQNVHDPLTQLNSHMGYGLMAGLNPFADMGLNPNDPNMLQTMMNSPEFLQQMSSLMSNPAVLDQALALNPQYAAMGPQAREIFQSERFRQMMSNPETLRGMMQMASIMRGAGVDPLAGPFGGSTPAAPGNPNAPPASNTASTTAAPVGGLATGATPPAPNPFGADPSALLQLLGGVPPSTDARPPEERFQVQLQQLQDMGFTNASQNVRALLATGGNVHSAIEYILGGGGL
jgi:ubiquilin